ncbi:MAG: ATP-binding protein [Pseudomonadota bacterium]
MNTPDRTVYSPSRANLSSLLAIRSIALLGQVGVLAYVVSVNRFADAPWGLALGLLALGAITAISLWRTTRPWPVSDSEFLGQLLVDVIGWTALMYFTGGANNPFVSYYIVPLVIAAAVLPWRYTWVITACSLAAYSLLIYVYQPFPLFTPHVGIGHAHDNAGQAHILGMWFNFLFSAGLITYFVVRMAATLRSQEDAAARQREERLRNDQIMAVAGLAAGTAHELGTPLGTMTVLIDEMLEDPALSPQQREDCTLLKRQLLQCRETLSDLVATAERSSVEQRELRELTDFARGPLERWAVRRPGVRYHFQQQRAGAPPQIEQDSTLGQAMENLLNNAADTGSELVEVDVSWDQQAGHIAIRDHGPGVSPENLPAPGTPVLRATRSGLGIGLLLSYAAVERHGGHIDLSNHPEGGAVATLTLPLLDRGAAA